MIEEITNRFANIVQDARVTAVSRIVGSAAVALETVVTRDTVDAFTAKRQVGYTLRAPRDYVRWRARIDAEPMRAYCKLKVGAAEKGFTVDIDKDSHSFELEVDSSDRGAVSFECGVVSRGAWSREVLAAEGAAEAERAGAADASLAAAAAIEARRAAAAGGSLGEALKNLQKYVQNESFDNQKGQMQEFGPLQFDTKGVEFGPWIRRFISQVRRNWFVPMAAQTMRGRVVITFNVHRYGALTDVTVVRPSEIESFSQSAVNALRASNPTTPLPPEYPENRAFFTVTLFYNENPPGQ